MLKRKRQIPVACAPEDAIALENVRSVHSVEIVADRHCDCSHIIVLGPDVRPVRV